MNAPLPSSSPTSKLFNVQTFGLVRMIDRAVVRVFSDFEFFTIRRKWQEMFNIAEICIYKFTNNKITSRNDRNYSFSITRVATAVTFNHYQKLSKTYRSASFLAAMIFFFFFLKKFLTRNMK